MQLVDSISGSGAIVRAHAGGFYGSSQVTFLLGWVAAIAAFMYKALTFSGAGLRVANSTGVTPRHFFEASLLMFVICIAEVTYSSLGAFKPGTGGGGR